MTIIRTLVLLALPAFAIAQAQPAALRLSDIEARQSYERVLQLIESGGVTMPDVGKAGLPLLESMRQTLESLKFLGFRSPQLHYRFQGNFRAWLLIADAVPKPALFPEQAKKQLNELRDLQFTLDAYLQQQLEALYAETRSPDRDNLKRYAESNSRLGPPASGKPRVVFMGDSITDGWRLNEYFPDRDFVNRGISGQITSQMLARFIADVAELRPAAMVFLGGTNDIARGVDMETVKRNVTAICDLADQHKIKVLLATLLPVSDYHMGKDPAFERSRLRPPATIRTFNEWLQGFARQRKYVVVDYYTPLLDARAQLAEDLADDGLHPNAKGYRVMAPAVLQAIDKLSPKAQPPARKRRLFQ